MSTSTTSELDAAPFPAVVLADGDLLVYDRDDHRAWIQSDEAVSLSDVR